MTATRSSSFVILRTTLAWSAVVTGILCSWAVFPGCGARSSAWC
jgi:hypothetical protein